MVMKTKLRCLSRDHAPAIQSLEILIQHILLKDNSFSEEAFQQLTIFKKNRLLKEEYNIIKSHLAFRDLGKAFDGV
jgi:hypothetical protein